MAERPPVPVLDRGVGPEVEVGRPIEVAPGVVRVTAPNASMMTGPGTNTYLIGTSSVVVLDPGPELADHLTALRAAIGDRPVSHVAVTHTHPDHAPLATPLARILGVATCGFGPGPLFEPDVVLADGARLGEANLEVLSTPGHASNHLCFVLEGRLAFTGDHVMHGSTVVIRPPDGSIGAYLESLGRLRRAVPSDGLLAPGHGRLLGEPHAAIDEVVGHRLAREAFVAEVLGTYGPGSAEELVAVVYPDLEAARTEVATVTLLAHLLHLVEQGRAERQDPDAVVSSTSRFVPAGTPA